MTDAVGLKKDKQRDYQKVHTLIVGAGPAGLCAAILLKARQPQLNVCVVDKGRDVGCHNLSGAVLEPNALFGLLDEAVPDWKTSEQAAALFARRIDKDNILFLLGQHWALPIMPMIRIAGWLKLGFGQMRHHGDTLLSVSELTQWLGSIARQVGVEVLPGFAVQDVDYDEKEGMVRAVRLVDQGLDKEGRPQPNTLYGETIGVDMLLLAEGCDGLLTESFVEKAGLQRQTPQVFSVGIKELIKVSEEQYQRFGSSRVVHAMGYPLWTPVLGPDMFGGGILYAGPDNHLVVGMIVGADWKYYDFNPQEALVRFKSHRFVRTFIQGGTVVEAGAKMIPEGGFYAIPRDPRTGSIGKGNVLLLGDCAGFVNMLKIKGLHLAVESGIQAACAVINSLSRPKTAAARYTELVEQSRIMDELWQARHFRQTVAKWGPLVGMPLSVLGGLLPKWHIEPDYMSMKPRRYRHRLQRSFDKDTFTALAATGHREDQPCHLHILDPAICKEQCAGRLNSPCVTFCPAGVYETVQDELKAANPSNCLHCKTCQRKCPYNNIRWTAPEGCGGPQYKRM